jgi:tetratricopeptide (TPR) repeat protein
MTTWHDRWPAVLRRRVAWLAIAVLLLVGLTIAYRVSLADRLWPQARAQQLRQAAELALAQDRLTAADGSGARELYSAALALDPDRGEDRAGLQRVGLAALAQARRATRAQRFDEAHAALRLARELAVPQPAADAVAETLREHEAEVAGIDTLLARAKRARDYGRLDGDEHAALPLYRRILALQPKRTEALEGREDALSELLQRAQEHVTRGDVASAAGMVDRAREYDPGHIGLPDARAALARAADVRRQQAARALRREQLQTATAGYRDALAVDPDDDAAQAGLQQVALLYAQRGERFAADFRFAEAERAIAAAHELAPQLPALAQARRHLMQARSLQARLQMPRGASRNSAQRVRELLAAAAAAEARGDLLGPPGESAFDHLRAARALAPGNAAVRRASARLLPAARDCFENELRGNRLVRAQACLDARIQLGDRNDLRESRRRLASRWIAVGDERLGAGEVEAAIQAHAAARALDPMAPGLDALGTPGD